MFEMSHTEEDLNEGGLYSADEKQLALNDVSRKCNTALEILQNEVINCEKSISLEKSQRELNEKKVECDQLQKVSGQVTAANLSNDQYTGPNGSAFFTIFNNDQFNELIENIMRVGNHFNGIAEDDVQKIIFEYAELNEIDHGFNKTLRKTENEWYQRFVQSHPNLNSVIRKPHNDSVQLHETDIEFSSRIVDKFVSDYKNNKRNVPKIQQSVTYNEPENEKYVDVASTTGQIFGASISHQKTDQVTYSIHDLETPIQNEMNSLLGEINSAVEDVCSGSFVDTAELIKNDQLYNSVSSACSINSVNECSAKDGRLDSYGNASNEELNDSLANTEVKKSDEGNVSEIAMCDSNIISFGKSLSVPAPAPIGTKETSDVIFPENPKSVSNLETHDVKRDTTDKSTKPESAAENSSSFENDVVKCDNNFAEVSTNNEKTSGQPTPNHTEENLSTETDGAAQGNDNILKRKRPSSRKTKKSKKYVYKLKSYNTVSVFQFTSSTPYSFMKPVIKLTKLDESSFKNSESDITSPPDAGVEQEANTVDEMETNSDCDLKDEGEVTTNSGAAVTTEQDVIMAELNSNVINDSKDEADTEPDSNVECSFKDDVETETNSDASCNSKDEVETETNTSANCNSKDEVETETNFEANCDSKDEVETKINPSANCNSKDEIEAGTNSSAICNSNDQVETETNFDANGDSKDEVETETNPDANCDSKDEVETEINPNANCDSKDEIETETNSNANCDSKDEVETETNSNGGDELEAETETGSSLNCASNLTNEAEANANVDPVDGSKESEIEAESTINNLVEAEATITNPDNDSKNESNVEENVDRVNDDSKIEIKTETNSDVESDSKCQETISVKTTAEKNLNTSTGGRGGSSTSKVNTSVQNTTPTFRMQTRRKKLKFLPDGTLVTPNQRLSHFLEDLSPSPRSESKSAKRKSVKTPPQDTPRPEKKMKLASTSSTPKPSPRPTPPMKKSSKNRSDRYVPESNAKSKKPQKIFDYEGYYKENFRQTEVKLPPSCKKQMIALSKVTSISPAAQSGAQYAVNPAQLLSCLLGMPVTPDQIRTVRFKPPVKQLKSYKEGDDASSKLASNDAIKPITKRHSENLQKKPFNNVSKTELGASKSNAVTKSKQAT